MTVLQCCNSLLLGSTKVSMLGNAASSQQWHLQHSQQRLTLNTSFRVSGGIESPEIAKKWLQSGTYPVIAALDMWAFGQMMMELTGSLQPADHPSITTDPAFHQELSKGLYPDDPESPRQRQHLEYLAGLCAQGMTAYSDQVHSTFLCNGCIDCQEKRLYIKLSKCCCPYNHSMLASSVLTLRSTALLQL